MQNVVCCNHARMRSSAGKSTQSRSSQGAAEIANASCVHSSGGRASDARYTGAGPGRLHLNACVCGRIESMAGRMSGDRGMREVNEL
jgi:hypothetical protein